MLLERKADLESKDKKGHTPLDLAHMRGRKQELLEVPHFTALVSTAHCTLTTTALLAGGEPRSTRT